MTSGLVIYNVSYHFNVIVMLCDVTEILIRLLQEQQAMLHKEMRGCSIHCMIHTHVRFFGLESIQNQYTHAVSYL